MKDRWDAQGLGGTVSGGIHHGQSPTPNNMPFAVFTLIAETPDLWTNTSRYARAVFQIAVFHPDPDVAGTLAKAVSAAFDFAPLSLEGGAGDVLVCQPGPERIFPETHGDRLVYMAVTQFVSTRRRNVNYSPG